MNMDDLSKKIEGQPSLEAITFTARDNQQLTIVVNAAMRAGCNYTVLADPERKGVHMVFVKGTQEQLKECVRIVSEL